MAQLQADAAKLESRAASYHLECQPPGPSWMCSSQAEFPADAYYLRRCRSDGGAPPRRLSNLTRSSPIASSEALQSLAEVELRPAAAEWELPGWKRLTDENEAQAGPNQAEKGAIRKMMLVEAEHLPAQKPANVRAVPKIFPH